MSVSLAYIWSNLASIVNPNKLSNKFNFALISQGLESTFFSLVVESSVLSGKCQNKFLTDIKAFEF